MDKMFYFVSYCYENIPGQVFFGNAKIGVITDIEKCIPIVEKQIEKEQKINSVKILFFSKWK